MPVQTAPMAKTGRPPRQGNAALPKITAEAVMARILKELA